MVLGLRLYRTQQAFSFPLFCSDLSESAKALVPATEPRSSAYRSKVLQLHLRGRSRAATWPYSMELTIVVGTQGRSVGGTD